MTGDNEYIEDAYKDEPMIEVGRGMGKTYKITKEDRELMKVYADLPVPAKIIKKSVNRILELIDDKEFNLSDKIFDLTKMDNGNYFLLQKDVKESVKRLKEELFKEAKERFFPLNDSRLDRLPLESINEIINKIFGDKLNGN